MWLVKGVQFIFDVLLFTVMPFYSVSLLLPNISLYCHFRIKLDCYLIDISIESCQIYCSDLVPIFRLSFRFFHRTPIFLEIIMITGDCSNCFESDIFALHFT